MERPVKLFEILATVKQIDIAMRGWRSQTKNFLCPSSEKVAGNSSLPKGGDNNGHFFTSVFHYTSKGGLSVGKSTIQ
ncbi:hypothetical protein [Rhizobium leguminosarum]|uniref:hypothetical protein n=1 Tax=Rhizobium leguminosarum TaxID=384 RepID=UPI003F9AC449